MSDLNTQQSPTDFLKNQARLRIKSTKVPPTKTTDQAPLQNDQKIASANPRKTDLSLASSVAKLFSGRNFD